MIRAATVLLLLLAGLGCRLPTACTTSVEPAVRITVVDSLTGEPAGDGAAVIIREGSYVDSLRPASFDGEGRTVALMAGDERAGRYDIEVQKVGHLVWARRAVNVPSGACGVETVALTARLRPQPPN